MPEKVLVVEDEPALLETLAYNLQKQGFSVQTAASGPEAVQTAQAFQPDLLILDVMLPGFDGFEVMRRLRKEMSVPILMLTARDDEFDRVLGLELGADDYLTKPFSMRELLARVKAQLRRTRLIQEGAISKADARSEILTFSGLEIDLARREVRLHEKVVSLKPKEFDLLLYLARNHGHALSRDNILEHVWGWTYTGETRTVDVHIRWLREKIEPDPANPVRLITVRGAGYRFEG